jgi:hypothetical protein
MITEASVVVVMMMMMMMMMMMEPGSYSTTPSPFI